MRRFWALDLRWKLMVPFALLTLVWATTGTFLATRRAVSDAEAQNAERLRSDLQTSATFFSEIVASHIEQVRLAAHTEGVAEASAAKDGAKLKELLGPLLANHRTEDLMTVLDLDGTEILSLKRRPGADIIETSLVLTSDAKLAVRRLEGQAVSDKLVQLAETANGETLIAGGAIRDGETAVGSLVVGSRISVLLLEMRARTGAAGIAMYGPSGDFVDSSGTVARLDKRVFGGQGNAGSQGKGQDVIVGDIPSRPDSTGQTSSVGHFAIFRPSAAILNNISHQAALIALLGLLALVAVVWLGSFLAKAITAPLGRVADTARAIAEGDLTQRANVREGDEVGTLGLAFNQMADRLQESYEELELKVEERTRELEIANQQLARVGQAKTDFLANMSHELRTPLNAILGYSELLADPFFGNAKPADVRKQARAIHQSGTHLLTLINDILDLSKIEAGKLVLHQESLPVKKTVKDVVALVHPLAEGKGIDLKVKLTKAPDLVRADDKRFRQILLNLLSNAIKFTPEGGTIVVEAEASKDGGMSVSVTDTGIGIPDEFKAKIFEQFLQVDGSYARKQEGTGLGLALTRRLVEMQGGKINVESQEGEGSRFTFTMPRATAKRSTKAS